MNRSTTQTTANLHSETLVASGVEGLDTILRGGFVPNRLYLVEGDPGTGKTTLAMQFLLEGLKNNEKVLYITLSETANELRSVAQSHHWSLEGIDLFELTSAEGLMDLDQEMTLLHPWEVELGEVVKKIIDRVKLLNPSRIAFDSLSELRLLASDPLRYRRQILALKQFFATRNCTVLLLDDKVTSNGSSDHQLHSISHGVISLERFTLEFGVARRRLEVLKLRGVDFRAGWHDNVIRPGGMVVFPRLVAAEHLTPFAGEPISSGLEKLDSLLDGGPLRGTSTLITGPAGCGKTTIALQYAVAAAKRGEKSAIYQFDERMGTLIVRAQKLGLDLEPHIEAGLIHVRQVDPSELSPGEFAHLVINEVKLGAKITVLDSLNGYMTAMPEEKQLLLQIHELLSYLNQKGVVTFLINPQEGLVGTMHSNINVSYIADSVLLMRYFEANGCIRKALSVIKNRGGNHEKTIREFMIDRRGLQIGDPLTEFQGIFTGTPTYLGNLDKLLNNREKQPLLLEDR